MKKVTFSSNLYHIAKWLRMKPMRWEFFMGYRCYSPNTWVMWTYPKSALSPISCVQTVACSIKNHKPWECKNLMQVSFKWLLEPHEIGVWHLQRAKTILYSWDGKSKKLDPPTTPISSVPSIYIYICICICVCICICICIYAFVCAFKICIRICICVCICMCIMYNVSCIMYIV